jgi:hypothetical protein
MVTLGKPQQYDAVAAEHYARAEWRTIGDPQLSSTHVRAVGGF